MQRQPKHTSITIAELLGYGVLNAFSVRGPCRGFIGDNEGRLQSLRVVGVNEKGSLKTEAVKYGLKS
jgi:hypothetical protein